MITIEEIYDIMNYEEPIYFAENRELENLRKIKQGEVPVREVFRRTGRSTFLIASAIFLASIGKSVAIKTETFKQALYLNHVMEFITKNINCAMETEVKYDNIYFYTNPIHLMGIKVDVYLEDSVLIDLRINQTGFYA